MKTVVITGNCGHCWYSDHIGQSFHVQELDEVAYIIMGGVFHGYLIKKSDCKLIEYGEKPVQHYDEDGNLIVGHFEYDVVKQTEKYIPYEESKIICTHPEWGTDGGGDYCKKCGYRL